MGLFAKEQESGVAYEGAPQRMLWTRELGTRKLVLGFVALMVIWFVGGKVQDHFLLQKRWAPLAPDVNGLSVVGTLDGRAYEQNMFRIVQANETSKVELTNRGWNDIFDGKNGEMFDDAAAGAIRHAIDVDGLTGYAMLEPYLQYGIDKLLHKTPTVPTKATLIPVEVKSGNTTVTKQVPLGELLKQFSGAGADSSDNSSDDSEGGGGGGGHEVDHGLAIAATTLIKVCPVVLVGKDFTDASLDENPGSMLEKKTSSVHLYLTPEGRSRFYQWSHDHSQEDLVFVLKDHIVIAGRIHQTMDVNDWQIGPMRDEAAAKELVSAIKAMAK